MNSYLLPAALDNQFTNLITYVYELIKYFLCLSYNALSIKWYAPKGDIYHMCTKYVQDYSLNN